MALWTRLFYASSTTQVVVTTNEEVKDVQGIQQPTQSSAATEATSPNPADNPRLSGVALTRTRTRTVVSTAEGVSTDYESSIEGRPANPKRFSFKRISFSRRTPQSNDKPALSTLEEHDAREKVEEAAGRSRKEKAVRLSRSDLRARKNALRVRMLITGEPTGSLPAVSPVVAKPQLEKIKTQLSTPKNANKLIQELRQLPATSSAPQIAKGGHHEAPIHAVCLEFADAEEESKHFAQLGSSPSQIDVSGGASAGAFPSIVSAPVQQLTALLNEMHVVELIRSPDLGIGQPGDGEGILAGAVPTPETVLKGVKEITPQLMALGFATGRAILPDHSGVYPPTDRISVLTYWWGLEILLPPPTIEYLSQVQSITSAVVNFLSAMALVNNGVREILPFVRYIAQFIDYEFTSIKAQNKGKGVVCAATWIMPAALVPRPWDFLDPPPPEPIAPVDEDVAGEDLDQVPPPLPPKQKTPTKLKRESAAPSLPKPRPVSSILDIVSKQSAIPASKSGSVGTIPSPPSTPVVSVGA